MNHPTANAVRGGFLSLAGPMAVATFLTMLAQDLHWSFRNYAWLTLLASLSTAVIMLRGSLPSLLNAFHMDRRLLASLFALGLAAALTTSFCYRENVDDFSYIPNALHFVTFPDTPMSHTVHFVYGSGEPIESYYVGTSMPFEYWQGIAAHFSGFHILNFYYVLCPAAFAFLVPLAWFFCISRFAVSERAAAAGAALLFLSAIWMGEGQRTFGNYSFNLLWQGKVVLMTLGIPLVVGMSIDFLRAPSLVAWLRVFTVATAFAGTSTSSIPLLIFLAPALAFSAAFAFRLPPREALLRTTLLGTAFLYLAVFALRLIAAEANELGAEDPISKGFAPTFWGQASYFFPRARPVSAVLFALSSLAAGGLLTGWARRFFAAWLVFVLVAYLNPWTAPTIMASAAPPTLYWRLFFLLPFPMAIGLAGARIAEEWWQRGSPGGNRLVAGLAALLLAAAFVPKTPSIFQYSTRLKPGHKISWLGVDWAEEIADACPPGPMLAPVLLGGRLNMVRAGRPQIVTRRYALDHWLSPEEAALRAKAGVYLWGMKRKVYSVKLVEELLRMHPRIQTVVAWYQKVEMGPLSELLEEYGFSRCALTGPFEAFARRRGS